MDIEIIENCPGCSSPDFEHLITTDAMMHNAHEQFHFMQCKSCKLVFLNPRVSPHELHKYYGRHYLPYRGPEAWGKYGKFVVNDLKKTDKARVKTLTKLKKIHQNSVILDVGCGKPTFLKTLTDQFQCIGMGTDFSDEGWKESPGDYKNLTLLKGDIHDLKIEKKPDIITMWHYLEHDYNPVKTLKKALEFSKKDTTLIIEVPNYNSFTREMHQDHWEGYHTPRHTSVFEPKTISSILERSGWEVIRIKKYGTLDPYSLHWMSKMEKKSINWSESMERFFWPYVFGMILTFPLFMLKKWVPMGVMTAYARPKK